MLGFSLRRCVPVTLVCLAIVSGALAQAPATQPQVVQRFDRPFLFAYGSWEGKVKVEAGGALLREVTNAGGAGYNVKLDVSAKATCSPALHVTVGPKNQAAALRLLLGDASGHMGIWEFPLRGVAGAHLLLPVDGAPLTEPNAIEKGAAPDLAHIQQVQLQGDWAGGKPLDVVVESVVLVEADEGMLAQRHAASQRHAAQAEAQRKERLALKEKFGKRTDRSPVGEHVSLVAANVLALEIQAGKVIPQGVRKYAPLPGDRTKETKNARGRVETLVLIRDGKEVGWLIGPKREWLTPYEGFEGDPLLTFVADDLAQYSVSSPDDPAYRAPLKPEAVFRKSKPNDWQQGENQITVQHTLYLRMPAPLVSGKHYVVDLGEVNAQPASVDFACDPVSIRSEAVHTQQIGFRADDPLKRTFVSCWMGSGGGLVQGEHATFHLVDDATNTSVFSGTVERHWPAGKPEAMARSANFNGADVARCDFSSFQTPGRYRVVVDGVGCGYPFEIGENVWRRAFIVQMRGLYNNRSGVELGPPFTPFKKPRDMHPDDGYSVTHTTYRAIEKGQENWDAILGGDTGKAANGWGGYHDAGDWNPRRVTHMRANMAALELFDLFPEYFAAVKLGEPPDALPDILADAVWEFECFHRMQGADGGVPYGMEAGLGDPVPGEVSWLNSFPTYVMAAEYPASWYYAAVGARLSRLLEKRDPKLATAYRKSAIDAFDFAERDFAKDKAAGLTAQRQETWRAIDSRNLAAVELYRLSRDARYHDLFLEDSVLKQDKPKLFVWTVASQEDAAFAYACLPQDLGDAQIKEKARAALCVQGNLALEYSANNAFNLTSADKYRPQAFGFYGVCNGVDLCRAHYLTHEARYLAGALAAAQFTAGCNPNNLVYTTGLGANPILHPLHLDSRRSGQPAPEGLTVYGNVDFARWNDGGMTWPITWHLGKVTYPGVYEWPTHEAYFDVYMWPTLCEFTVDFWAPNIWVWGYLAARPG